MNWTMAPAAGTMKPSLFWAEGAIPSLLIYLLSLDDPSLEDEFRRFFDQYAATALRVARRHLDGHLAQDAVQDAFVRLAACFSVIAALTPRQQKSYLLTTVRNCSIDLLRREGRYAGLEEDETLPGGLEPERAAQASAGYDALVAAVLSMPPTYREILERRLVLEQTPAEVAAAMGLRVDTVNARFSRGRKLLREKLMEEGIYP